MPGGKYGKKQFKILHPTLLTTIYLYSYVFIVEMLSVILFH